MEPIHIELLALDLATCGRCTRTSQNLDDALQQVAETLRATDTEVTVTKTVVRTLEEAERLRFVSSPTIRVNGRDIALELRESACADCGPDCGCGGGVACRVWVWRGREHTEAPKAMIVDAILRAYGTEVAPPARGRYRVPENLRRALQGGAACCQ
jgi:hypothetical protein